MCLAPYINTTSRAATDASSHCAIADEVWGAVPLKKRNFSLEVQQSESFSYGF